MERYPTRRPFLVIFPAMVGAHELTALSRSPRDKLDLAGVRSDYRVRETSHPSPGYSAMERFQKMISTTVARLDSVHFFHRVPVIRVHARSTHLLAQIARPLRSKAVLLPSGSNRTSPRKATGMHRGPVIRTSPSTAGVSIRRHPCSAVSQVRIRDQSLCARGSETRRPHEPQHGCWLADSQVPACAFSVLGVTGTLRNRRIAPGVKPLGETPDETRLR